MKTYLPKDHLEQRKWHIVDADGVVLGRLAEKVADVLRGKNKPIFTPMWDAGDFVVVINADKVKVTGKKLETHVHTYYTGFPGGLRHVGLGEHIAGNPEEVIQIAVKRMLPKNRLARQMLARLKVYRGAAHPHAAQKPASAAAK